MLNSIFHAGSFALESVAIAIVSALVLGGVIAVIYKLTSPQAGKFSVLLVILPMLVSSIIMVVNGNIGISVAVHGAFSLARFRSATGTAKEMGFIVFTMAVGLAIGVGFITLAAIVVLVAGLTILILEKARFGESLPKERELRITIPEDLNYTGIFDDLFQEYTKHARLESVRTTNMGTMYELSYRVELRDMEKEKEFIDALRCRNGNLTIIFGFVQRERNVL